MESYSSALNKLMKNTGIPGEEIINVLNAYGRVPAENLRTDYKFPECKKSAVDGYALKFVEDNTYLIAGESAPGAVNDLNIEDGECVFVMTGGAVPENADAVVRVEDTEKMETDKIKVQKIPEKGMNINFPGEEFFVNEIFAEKGHLVKDLAYPVLCYSGKSKISVYKKVKIGVFVTGDEIIEPGDKYKKGHVFNTNRYILESMLKELPVDIQYLGRFDDNEREISKIFGERLHDFDILVSSGGVSMGKYDFVKKILNENAYEIIVNKTAIKPGSPLMVAKNEKCTIFGMPGYPAAFATNLILYLLPFVRKSCGIKNFANVVVKGKLGTPMRSRRNALYFNRAVVKTEKGEFVAYDPGSQKTSHFLNFFNVNGLVIMDENVGALDKDSLVDIVLMRGL